MYHGDSVWQLLFVLGIRDYAYGALAMGADAVRAVEVACEYDNGCGMGIDVLTIEGESNEIEITKGA